MGCGQAADCDLLNTMFPQHFLKVSADEARVHILGHDRFALAWGDHGLQGHKAAIRVQRAARRG